MTTKKKTRRARDPYPGLKPNLNLRNRQELIDHDYIDKLSHEEKKFLSNFNEEYIGGNFKHSGKILHRTKEEKRKCYGRNNARNRDLFSHHSTRGWMAELPVEEVLLKDTSAKSVNISDYDLVDLATTQLPKVENPEDFIIELLDLEYERQISEFVKTEDEST